MKSPQRLPASLTPVEVARAALLRGLKTATADAGPPPSLPHFDVGAMPELRAWPPHDIAAVDGWALRASDLVGASSYTPLPLMTRPVWVEAGDRIPDGCDCVIDEDALDDTGPIAQVLAEAIPGQGIRRKGGEVADVSTIATAWRPADLREAIHTPRLRVVNVPGGAMTSKLITRGLQQAGVDTTFVAAAGRDVASIAAALDADDCDLLLIVGGSGVGRTDAAVMALAERGEVIAHGLALQPGRTAAIGSIGGTAVMVLPGAPDQAIAAWWTLVLPVLDHLTQPLQKIAQRKIARRPLARKIASSVGVAEIVLLEEEGGAFMPLAVGDLPFASLARADAWLLVPGGSEGYAAGTQVDAYMLRE